MSRESFIFYKSFADAMIELNDEQCSKLFKAITKFAIYGEEPDISGIEKAMFLLMKPQLVANQKRYENGCKANQNKGKEQPSENQTDTEVEPSENQTESNAEPNENDNDNVNNKVSKQVSKEKDNNNTHAHESYDSVFKGFGCKGLYKDAVCRFIAYLKNSYGIHVSNDRLETLLVRLDMSFENDILRAKEIDETILKGFKYVDCEMVGA